MRIPLKIKLRLALIFLFGLMLAVVTASHFALFRITERTRGVFEANYQSLDYVEKMRDALEAADLQRFEATLQKQEGNITEVGETEATSALRTAFSKLEISPSDTAARREAVQHLAEIHQLNREAIVRANDATFQMAERFAGWLALLGTVAALVAFGFIFNFPHYIAQPVERLTEGIRQIAEKNYAFRIHEHSNDEFGEMTRAFNNLAERLEGWEQSSLAAIVRAKQRVEAVIALFPDAVVGLSEERKIIFVNPAAAALLALKPEEIVGRHAPDVALHNDLLRELLKNEPGATASLNVFADGQEQRFEASSQDIWGASGERIGRVLWLRRGQA